MPHCKQGPNEDTHDEFSDLPLIKNDLLVAFVLLTKVYTKYYFS